MFELRGSGRGLSKSVIRWVIIGVTPFRVLITLLISYLLSPLPLQVGSLSNICTLGSTGLGRRMGGWWLSSRVGETLETRRCKP